ncbi:MSHA biogenesis protein MshP [Vibrio vulnificus]|uniref:MSHA biogenesis protein MshP n=1 Tax=Vibrio vulnificus TaxID=672 RepID=UPI001CCB1ADF|nr:MSHA biogenesis protein MshP [Vibrio vulnificus]MCA0771855.1 MSHA biogenesis protein MshP [Vibrio vulnificus]MCJ0813585.1 MSHA biogenesis protein MshP [Vibrio vulnificus]MCR9703592.1 MSHA biogenesis protein MshP [Vibrio vulnificus]HDY7841366.1 MSHA biogenesis protein MshP [Vibrio vulnificus]HDY7946678.1 MSHA biogenesis protein MshP [Vibrio vulnificus]
MFPNRRKQQGNMLVVAIFVIVVMGFLASSLTRINWSNSDNLTREQLGTQAWLMAQSANEWALTQLYPLGFSVSVSSACATINIKVKTPNVSVNSPCRPPQMTCQSIGQLQGETFYRVEAIAVCGSGILEVERRQEVWVKE